MTTIGRALRGTTLGILAAWLAFPAMATFYNSGWQLKSVTALVLMPFILLFLALFSGPGAFLLSCIHARQMENWAPRARTVRQIRKVGVLLGLPLGVANLVLVFGIFALLDGQTLTVTAERLPWLIPAIAGGAGLGWGVTSGLKPGCARPTPGHVVRRTRPPLLRRNGPPFFDNRASRVIRRAG